MNGVPLINAADVYGTYTQNLFGIEEDKIAILASGEITGIDKQSQLTPTYSWVGMIILLVAIRLLWEFAPSG